MDYDDSHQLKDVDAERALALKRICAGRYAGAFSTLPDTTSDALSSTSLLLDDASPSSSDQALRAITHGLTGLNILRCASRISVSCIGTNEQPKVRKHFNIRGSTIHGIAWHVSFSIQDGNGGNSVVKHLSVQMAPPHALPFRLVIERAQKENNPHLFLSTLSHHALCVQERYETFSRISNAHRECIEYAGVFSPTLRFIPSVGGEWHITFHWDVQPQHDICRSVRVASKLHAYPHVKPTANPRCAHVMAQLPLQFHKLVRRVGPHQAIEFIVAANATTIE